MGTFSLCLFFQSEDEQTDSRGFLSFFPLIQFQRFCKAVSGLRHCLLHARGYASVRILDMWLDIYTSTFARGLCCQWWSLDVGQVAEKAASNRLIKTQDTRTVSLGGPEGNRIHFLRL